MASHPQRPISAVAVLASFPLLVVMGWISLESQPVLAAQPTATPQIVSLELRAADCVPFILGAPAELNFQLSIENTTDGDRVLILPPNGRYLSVSAQDTKTVTLRLTAGDYRLHCGPNEDIRSVGVDVPAIDPLILDPPFTPLATPVGDAVPLASPGPD
jgi:hypothetical protein